MLVEVGKVEAIFRYPVKSMAGEQLDTANLRWHGIEGDRRLAFRRVNDRSGMPWLTASQLPDLLRYTPHRDEANAGGDLPTHIRTLDGQLMSVFGETLANEIGKRHGAPVQVMHLRHGIFDETPISLITSATVCEIVERSLDARQFRPNIVVRLPQSGAFQEDAWLNGAISFGEGSDAPEIVITMRDERCSMVNLNPDSAIPTPEVMKAIVRMNQNTAGVYGAVTRPGRLTVGQTVVFREASEKR
ncbi:MAG: hypothetical protein C5B58_03830 [Acidobacteria bacterium]|nr:MAG: hypothetical protein C5B58_03830 [Acidobacteriota bacterium]